MPFFKRAALVLAAIAWMPTCALAAASAVAGKHRLSVSKTIEEYQVMARGGKELVTAMESAGPSAHGARVWAYTTWTVDWHFTYDKSGAACRLTQSTTSLRIKMQMPRWANEADAVPAQRERWRRMLRAIRDHEEQHAAHGQLAANQVRALLQSNISKPNCEALAHELNQRANAIIATYAARDVAFDQRTRHGLAMIRALAH